RRTAWSALRAKACYAFRRIFITTNRKYRKSSRCCDENSYHQFMLITILVGVAALLLGAALGWLVANRRALVAEARLAALDQDKFLALAQRAFAQLGESLVRMNKTQVDGSLDTKTAEIGTLLVPAREM